MTHMILNFWGSFPGLAVLILMIVSDVGFGIAVAWVTKTLSSKYSQLGMLRKAGILIVATMSIAIENATSTVVTIPLSSMICTLFAVSEFISIVENAAMIGIPVPQQVAEVLIVLKRNYKPVDIRTVTVPEPPEPESDTP